MTSSEKVKPAPKSIRTRLVRNFIIIILVSVLAFEGMLVYFTKFYFYGNVESILTNQIRTAADFYAQYFSNVSLEVNIIDNADVFWRQTNAQVQIIQKEGEVLLDSEGIGTYQKVDTADVRTACKGEKGVWTGYIYNAGKKEHVMAVAYPLTADGEQVGVLRFITSLSQIDKLIFNISGIFIGIGVVVVLVTIIISLILAQSIVRPLMDITAAAGMMAKGNLDIRIKKKRNDEIGVLSDTLNYMVAEVQNRERIKNDFISTVSHELRTPLTSIKGWANTIIDDGFNDKEIIKDGLNIIVKESDRLANMVEELLDFSRFVSGKVELNRQKTDISELINFIEKHMMSRAKKENINFAVYCENNLPEVELDRDKIKQVLLNLLGNSFKFTQAEGAVSLRSYYEEGHMVFKVEDNGCGISSEELPFVKEKFFKGKNSKSQTGLGLSICDEIVRMHNGELTIESEQGRGTVVTVKIPC
mgnify:CR=1 FL=1